MAIAFDASASGSALPNTSVTFSHTCSGMNRILIVGIQVNGDTVDRVTGVTYNSVAMTRATNGFVGAGSQSSYLYFLVNPTTGSNNIVVSLNTSTFARAVSASYSGAKQTGQVDASANNSAIPGTTLTTTLTTIADNCWVVGFIGDDLSNAISASTGVNAVRGSVGTVVYLGDSNGPDTPPSSYGMTWTSASQNLTSVQASISPARPPTGSLLSMFR